MWEDPIVNEVRKIRENLEAEFNFETKAIFNDIRRRQSALGSRLVCRKKQKSAEHGTEADRGLRRPDVVDTTNSVLI